VLKNNKLLNKSASLDKQGILFAATGAGDLPKMTRKKRPTPSGGVQFQR
jgi:hypothetical protein